MESQFAFSSTGCFRGRLCCAFNCDFIMQCSHRDKKNLSIKWNFIRMSTTYYIFRYTSTKLIGYMLNV